MHLSIRNLRAHVCAERRGRYSLNRIALTDKGSVSTDGQSLLLVPYPQGNGRQVPPADKPILISPEDAGRVASLVKEKSAKRRGYATEEKTIEVKLPESVLKVSATAEGRIHETTVNIQDGEFPRVGHVIPDFAKALTITFELEDLLHALKALRLASNGKRVTVRVNSAEEGAGFSTDDGVGLLLMPVTCDPDHPPASDALTIIREKAEETAPGSQEGAPNRPPERLADSTHEIQEVSVKAPGPLAPPAAPDDEGDEASDFTDEDEGAMNEDEALVLGGEPEDEDLSAM
ncbi:MAG: hypothetical protein HPKKFMNG_02047 [Planctomycetes bacterium]|nr:hypothetical protein [Planctomycetota bacterium]